MILKTGMHTWFLQRITAAFLLFGLAVHFVWLHWFTARPVTLAQVKARLCSAPWIIFDALLLAAALYHMLYGLYGILLDFNPKKGTKAFAKTLLWTIGIVGGVFGLVALGYLRGV
jgi:succinate dehydrogenase hydrophobic membrane anchor protein